MATPDDYPLGTIAKLLDLTERRVNQLTAEGVIPKIAFGRYQLVPAVQDYIRYLRRRAINSDPASADELGNSRAQLLKARARLAQLEAEQLEGKLLPRSDVEKAWIAIIAAMRTRLLAIPQTAAQEVILHQMPADAAAYLTSAISDALDDIACTPVYTATDPWPLAEVDAQHSGGAEGSEVPAEADRLTMGGSEADAELSVFGRTRTMEHEPTTLPARNHGYDGRPIDPDRGADDLVAGGQD